MLHRRLSPLLAILVLGCGSAGARPPATPASSELQSTEPREALDEANQFLEERGWRRMGPALRNPKMRARGIVAYAVRARDGSCYTAMGIAEQHADLNMVVVDPAGRKVGHNVAPDPYPWVTFCPRSPGHHIVRLQMGSVASEYVYAIYQAPQGTPPPLTSFFPTEAYQSGSTPPAPILDRDTRKVFRSIDRTLVAQGYVRPAEPRGLMLTERSYQDVPVQLRRGYCYAFASLASNQTNRINASVLNSEGRLVAKNDTKKRNVVLKLCPKEPGRHVLRTIALKGSGAVFVAAWARSEGTAPSATDNVIKEATSSEELEANFRLLKAEMEARGYSDDADMKRAALSEGGSESFILPLQANTCYAVMTVSDDGVQNLDLSLNNPAGTVIDRDFGTDATPVVRACTAAAGDFRLEARMVKGSGQFAYAAFPWPRGTRGPFGLQGLIYLRLAEATSLLTYEGYQPAVEYDPVRGSIPREGRSGYHELELPADRCLAVVVVGGDGVHQLQATLALGGQTVAEDRDQTSFPVLRHCTTKPGTYLLNIRAAHGAGDYFYQIFRRQ